MYGVCVDPNVEYSVASFVEVLYNFVHINTEFTIIFYLRYFWTNRFPKVIFGSRILSKVYFFSFWIFVCRILWERPCILYPLQCFCSILFVIYLFQFIFNFRAIKELFLFGTLGILKNPYPFCSNWFIERSRITANSNTAQELKLALYQVVLNPI